MAALDEDELLLNIKEDLAIKDELEDTVLKRLMRKVIDHFTFEYGDPQPKHGFIIEDCVIKRYNRRDAEGASSVSVEGHSVTYEDKYEFEPYHHRLAEEFRPTSGRIQKGSVHLF